MAYLQCINEDKEVKMKPIAVVIHLCFQTVMISRQTTVEIHLFSPLTIPSLLEATQS